MDSASLEYFIKQEISHEMAYLNLDQQFDRMADLPPQSPAGFEYNAMNNLINLEPQQNFTNSCVYPSGDFMNWNNLGKNTGQNECFDAGDLKFLCEFLDSDIKIENNVPFEAHVAISTNQATITTTTFSTTTFNAAAATASTNAVVNATNPTPAATNITANTTFAAAATYGTATTVASTSAKSKLPIPPASVSSNSVVRSMHRQTRTVLLDTSMASRMPPLPRTIFSDTGMIRRVPPLPRTIFSDTGMIRRIPPQPTTILPAPSIIRQVPTPSLKTIPRDTDIVIRERAPVKAEPERKEIIRRPPMGRFRKSALLELEDIQKYFGMPIIKAAKEMKVGLTVLKKRCRELNITRWPHRKIKSLKTLIKNVKEMGLDLSEIEMLEEHRKLVERLPHLELNERAKKLRQACFKDNYKKRRSMARV